MKPRFSVGDRIEFSKECFDFQPITNVGIVLAVKPSGDDTELKIRLDGGETVLLFESALAHPARALPAGRVEIGLPSRLLNRLHLGARKS